ncbi:MAG: hypothetical protein NC293_07825 [Roseburia sp.]|nr:hypothetical protein [Roseburia sp.]
MDYIYNSDTVIYLLGMLLMSINIIRSIWSKKGMLFNPSQLEKTKDDRAFIKIRILYSVSQGIMLILFLFCFVMFKNYVAAIIGFVAGELLPIVLVLLYDSYLNYRQQANY